MMVRFLTTLFSIFILFTIPAKAAVRVVTEGTAATNYTITIDTNNTRVLVASDSYRGGIANVGLYASKNVVISSSQFNNIVFYATGSIVLRGIELGGSNSVFLAWMTTTSPKVAAIDSLGVSTEVFRLWQSTETPVVEYLRVWMGTTSPKISVIDGLGVSTEVFRSWQSTMTPAVSVLQVWMSSASTKIVAIDGLGVSTETLKVSLSTNMPVLEALRVSASTNNPVIESSRVSLSTNMPVVNNNRVSLSTNMPVLENLRVSASTNNPVIESSRVSLSTNMPVVNNNRVSLSTNMPVLEALRASAATNYVLLENLRVFESTAGPAIATKLSSAAIPAVFVDLSTVSTALGAKLSSITINGSLLGAGSASNNLGVDPSSVVIKSSNLIRNSEVDATSVTKQGNIFNGTSQLTKTDSNGILSGVIVSSVGATGVGKKQTCGSATISCSFDVTSDGRITRLSSATITGGSSFTSEVSTWGFLSSGLTSTDGTTGHCITGSSLVVTTGGGVTLVVWFEGNVAQNIATASIFVNVIEDGVFMDSYGSTSGTSMKYTTGSGQVEPYTLNLRVLARAAGSHTYCISFAGSTGTITIGSVTRSKWGVYEPAH